LMHHNSAGMVYSMNEFKQNLAWRHVTNELLADGCYLPQCSVTARL
jgi:hypothetical protein